MTRLATSGVLRLHDAGTWEAFLDRLPRKDVTYYPRFLRVYEEKGDGQAECFFYEDGDRFVLYPYIRRPLATQPAFGAAFADYSDAVTPYCYGGFVHNAADPREGAALVATFRAEFDRYAADTRLVSEFIRFHPLLETQRHAGQSMRVVLHRHNVVMDLAAGEDVLLRRCRRTSRHCIAHARRAGLRFSIDASPASLARFAALYRETMRRHEQWGYLNFPARYFDLLVKHLGDDCVVAAVWHEESVCAMAIFLRHEDYLDYFLSAWDPRYARFFPNHYMIFEAACWARRQGVTTLHLGGGSESLCLFKRGFSTRTVPYFVGEKIHDDSTTVALIRHRFPGMDDEGRRRIPYMPPYRYGLE